MYDDYDDNIVLTNNKNHKNWIGNHLLKEQKSKLITNGLVIQAPCSNNNDYIQNNINNAGELPIVEPVILRTEKKETINNNERVQYNIGKLPLAPPVLM